MELPSFINWIKMKVFGIMPIMESPKPTPVRFTITIYQPSNYGLVYYVYYADEVFYNGPWISFIDVHTQKKIKASGFIVVVGEPDTPPPAPDPLPPAPAPDFPTPGIPVIS